MPRSHIKNVAMLGFEPRSFYFNNWILHFRTHYIKENVKEAFASPRCPSADEWIRKLWYIYIMESYSAIKKNAFESVPMRWMKPEPIIQSEVNQKEKYQYRILTHIYGI